MNKFLKDTFRPILRRYGFDLVRYPSLDFDDIHLKIFNTVRKYTMTSPERVYTLIEAVKYISKAGIPGCFVECGVWRGGSAMTMSLALKEMGDESRDIYLYDTFTGMSEPTTVDISYTGEKAPETFARTRVSESVSKWCMASLEDVKSNVLKTGYPENRFHFVKGKVEETIPSVMPDHIALLRLDTDWYESTKHELKYLFPHLAENGILLIDDYGHWKGSRKAVDEYIAENKLNILLNRIDDSGRLCINHDAASRVR
jgi:hypothetical protein